MATVPVTLNGVLFPKGRSANDQPIPCTFVGEAWYTDLGVGGGPIIPPPGSGQPPGFPAHPIVPPGGYPHPEHPIVLPPPIDPPIPPDQLPSPVPPSSVIKEPPATGGWGLYSDSNGAIYWGYTPGVAGPKS
jgi:hypothetical protein